MELPEMAASPPAARITMICLLLTSSTAEAAPLAEAKTVEIAPNVFSARCLQSIDTCLTVPSASDSSRICARALFAVPKINLGTCCGSSPNVGLAPWLKAGGTGIDTAWS